MTSMRTKVLTLIQDSRSYSDYCKQVVNYNFYCYLHNLEVDYWVNQLNQQPTRENLEHILTRLPRKFGVLRKHLLERVLQLNEVDTNQY
jgi:hypothetical protein